MTPPVKNILRFVSFILLQVYVLNQIPPVHYFIVPYLYFLYILWLPFSLEHIPLMLTAFFYGLCLDFFTNTAGLHSAACVLIAFLRPYILSVLITKESSEQSYGEPGIRSMGLAPYGVYIGMLTFVHHFYLVLLEWLQFGDFGYFLGKVAGTTGISLLLIFMTELVFNRNAKFRTNQ